MMRSPKPVPHSVLGASSHIRRFAARALAAAVLLATSPCFAEGPIDAPEANKKAAQQLLGEGNQLLGDGEDIAALEKFRGAYERYPSPKILLNIGTTLRQLGRNVEAAAVYESYLRDPGAEPTRAADLRRILNEIDAIVGRIRIETSERSVAVRLDGKPLEGFVSGASLRVEPGDHTVVASTSGFPPAVYSVKLQPREEHLVTLVFKAPEVKSIFVDRVVAGTQRTIALTLGGLGAAGIVAGIASGIVAKVKDSAADEHCLDQGPCDARGVELGRSATTSATISTITFAAGAGLLGTGVVLFVTAPSAKHAPSPELDPGRVKVSFGGTSLQIGGAW